MKPLKKKKTENKLNSSLLVGFDFTRGTDVGVLLVGKQENGEVTIVNAIQGQEAWDLYQRLVTVKKEGGSDQT